MGLPSIVFDAWKSSCDAGFNSDVGQPVCWIGLAENRPISLGRERNLTHLSATVTLFNSCCSFNSISFESYPDQTTRK